MYVANQREGAGKSLAVGGLGEEDGGFGRADRETRGRVLRHPQRGDGAQAADGVRLDVEPDPGELDGVPRERRQGGAAAGGAGDADRFAGGGGGEPEGAAASGRKAAGPAGQAPRRNRRNRQLPASAVPTALRQVRQ
jgi:hypothetical protein